MLTGGSVLADEVYQRAEALGVSERTLKIAKKNLGVVSERQGEQWCWRLPGQECKGVSV